MMGHFQCSLTIDFEAEDEDEAANLFLAYVFTDMRSRDVDVVKLEDDRD